MSTTTRHAFLSGCQAALPIALGYIPVAIAFGMATTSAGMPPWLTAAMSLFIYAGASQFLLFASIMSGASVLAVVGLCALLDSRHLLYAPLMKRHLRNSQGMVWIAPLITDEVFATAMTKIGQISQQKPWLLGLSVVSWLSWWGGTIVGIYGGKMMANFPTLSAAMNFAFVALFFSLSAHTFKHEPRQRIGLLVAAITAAVCTYLGHGEVAILVAGFLGVLTQLIVNSINKRAIHAERSQS